MQDIPQPLDKVKLLIYVDDITIYSHDQNIDVAARRITEYLDTIGAKIPKGPKPEKFVSTVDRCRCIKGFLKDVGRVRSEWRLQELMLFATSSSAESEKACQSNTCLQCCIKVQRSMPKGQATSRTRSTWVDWDNIQILII